MAPKTHKTFDFEQLTFGSQTTSTRSGGKCVRVGYGPTYSQVEFQLGTMPENTLVCAWGAELANKEDPTSGKIMKLELDEASHTFLTRFDEATVAAANQYSQSWFNCPTPTHSHNSSSSKMARFPMEILDPMLSRLRSRKKDHVLPKYPFVASMVTRAPRIGSQARWPTLSKARVSLFAVACKVAYTLSRGCMVAVSRLLVYGWSSMTTPRKMVVTTLIWAIVSWWTPTMLTHCHEAVRLSLRH